MQIGPTEIVVILTNAV